MHHYIYNVGSLFSKVSSDNAEKVALKYPDGNKISYSQLESLSNQVAHFLLGSGLKKGDVVAIFNNKSPLAYSCMLAALKTGIIYTNLDLTSPYQRIKKIVERCKPKLLLFDIQNNIHKEISELGIPSIFLDENFGHEVSKYNVAPCSVTGKITGSEAAYIMFTSGSTGFPKGAVITHSNLLNFISWGQTEFGITGDDIFTNANPIYFDNSVFDFYISLFSGAQLVPLNNEITRDPFTLVKEVARAGCTIWFSVPSLLLYLLTTKALAAGSLPSITRFIFGGEGFPKPKLKKLFELYGHARLFNVYGPTECTCICSSYQITESDFDDMNNLAPLGLLAPNFDYVLINTDDSGKFGELCIKGPNVGAGYYNDHERTQNSFIQNPYNADYKEIVYKSGDLVRVDEAGYLHFKGRADNQIKHMGYRIELEEIESVSNTLGYVDEAAVVYRHVNDYLGHIICFVALASPVAETRVIADLKSLLPEYMVPHKVYILEKLPKNANGKVDKVALKQL